MRVVARRIQLTNSAGSPPALDGQSTRRSVLTVYGPPEQAVDKPDGVPRTAARVGLAGAGATNADASRPSAPQIRNSKGGSDRIVMLTAYDAPGARVADQAGVDMILVGDSVGMVVLGYENTLQVTVDDMAHHTAAVARAHPKPMIVSDMPWMSYHTGTSDAVNNAARLVRSGAQAVKLEGGRRRLEVIDAILDAEIPVMGHLGLTPQSVNALGGFRVQAKDLDAVRRLIDDALALEAAGCFAIVIEAVPDVVGQMVTEAVGVPTVGIGAGPCCDGQVLVYHDLLGMDSSTPAKFVRRYASLHCDAVEAVRSWASDVRRGAFPSDSESYHLASSLDVRQAMAPARTPVVQS